LHQVGTSHQFHIRCTVIHTSNSDFPPVEQACWSSLFSSEMCKYCKSYDGVRKVKLVAANNTY